MNKIKYILISCVIALAFTSCEEREFIFPDDMAYASFKTPDNSNSLELEKAEGDTEVIEIAVAVAAHKGATVTVNFDISVEGISNPAIENDDFEILNTSRVLTFSERSGVEYIRVRLINNDIINESKEVKFVLTSATVQLGLPEGKTQYLLRITDDDNLLAPYLGTWKLKGEDVTISRHPSDETKVIVNGLMTVNRDFLTQVDVIADINLEAKTLTLPGNSVISINGPAFGDNEGKKTVICVGAPGAC